MRLRRGWEVYQETSALSALCCSLTPQRTCACLHTHTHTTFEVVSGHLVFLNSLEALTSFLPVCRYKKYVFLDPLAGVVTKTHNTLETEKEEKPFDAPLSITKREQLERQVGVRSRSQIQESLPLTSVMFKYEDVINLLTDHNQDLTVYR